MVARLLRPGREDFVIQPHQSEISWEQPELAYDILLDILSLVRWAGSSRYFWAWTTFNPRGLL